MKKLLSAACAALFGLATALPASAQIATGYQAQVSNRTVMVPDTAANPHPITCISGCSSPVPFTPTGAAVLSVTTSTGRVALPSADATVLLTNNGTADLSFKLGSGSVTAATTDYLLPSGRSIVVAAGANVDVAAITASGSSSLAIITGTGSPTISGGGGSGGGGGAVTNAGTFAVQNTASIVAGSAVIGHVIVDTAPSTAITGSLTNISGTVSLPTGASTAALQGAQGTGSTYNPPTGGSGEIGYLSGLLAAAQDTTTPSPVKIDQTTDGTTNAVHLVAGTALAGKFGIDQTTAGTTNGVQDAATSATGSAVPAKAGYLGANSAGNLTGLIQADSSAAISVSTGTTTQLVALSTGKKIYVTSFDVIAGGTGNITFEYGTGSACATGTTVLTGAYNLTAQAGLTKGNGLGPVLVVPASNALCVLTSAAVQMSGSVAYTQF